jgi:hypothetical protein
MPDEESRRSGAADVAKALAWPIVALVALVAVGGPVRTLLFRAGDVLGASSKVSVGSFSLEVQKAAAKAGDPELGELIRGLGSEAIKLLLNTGESQVTSRGMFPPEGIFPGSAVEDLHRAGLLEFEKKNVGELQYWLTARGKKAFNLIVDAVSRQATAEHG